MGMGVKCKKRHIISYNLNVPATPNSPLRLRSTCAVVHVSAHFAISFRKVTVSLTMFNRCH